MDARCGMNTLDLWAYVEPCFVSFRVYVVFVVGGCSSWIFGCILCRRLCESFASGMSALCLLSKDYGRPRVRFNVMTWDTLVAFEMYSVFIYGDCCKYIFLAADDLAHHVIFCTLCLFMRYPSLHIYDAFSLATALELWRSDFSDSPFTTKVIFNVTLNQQARLLLYLKESEGTIPKKEKRHTRPQK